MALAAAGRDDAARRMLDGMRAFGGGDGTVARIVRDVALPICEAVLAHRQAAITRARSTLMRPVLGDMYQLGGSHAQQDVLEQLFLDCAREGRLRRATCVSYLIMRASARFRS